jgi:hypothetical protein
LYYTKQKYIVNKNKNKTGVAPKKGRGATPWMMVALALATLDFKEATRNLEVIFVLVEGTDPDACS